MLLDTLYFEVGDIAKVRESRDFYRDHFGLEVTSEHDDESVWLRAGSLTLGFHVGEPPDRPWSCNIGFAVDDVDSEVARLEAAGVAISIGPADLFWGRAASLVDPNGFTIWLTQRS